MPQPTFEVFRLAMPLVRPFRTSRGVETVRDVLVARFTDADGATGWAESAADPEPTYFPEYIDSVLLTIDRILLPLLGGDDVLTAGSVRRAFANVPGNPLAKGLVETAVLDAQLRRHDMPLVDYLVSARRPIAVGVSVGIPDDLDTLLSWVSGYLDDGYRRVKLKIQPGWDLAPVRAVREAFGPDLPLQVDANQAYSPADVPLLSRLDEFGLLLLEQPFARHELLAHAALAARHGTPVCLDESLDSVGALTRALQAGALDVASLKPARLGGVEAAAGAAALCGDAGVQCFVGGMFELGVGRAAALALASLPGCTLPTDLGPSGRYFVRDVCEPLRTDALGCVQVPRGAGVGRDLDDEVVAAHLVERVVLEA